MTVCWRRSRHNFFFDLSQFEILPHLFRGRPADCEKALGKGHLLSGLPGAGVLGTQITDLCPKVGVGGWHNALARQPLIELLERFRISCGIQPLGHQQPFGCSQHSAV